MVMFNSPESALKDLLAELVKNHPYETPVIDIYDLKRHPF
jgi:hypothetical protein